MMWWKAIRNSVQSVIQAHKEVIMRLWIQIRWLGKGLQIASAIVGGGIALMLLQTSDQSIRWFVTALLWTLGVGLVLDLCYEIHLLQEEARKKHTKK